MKRNVLMVMLLVAGGLALVFLASWAQAFLSFGARSFGDLWGASGSGEIGSVSAGFSAGDLLLGPILVLGPSFLLWRACASLAAGGDLVMGWHRRFHGWAAIGGLLLIPSVVALCILALAMFPPDPMTPGGDWTWIMAFPIGGLIVASFGLNVMQLRSVAVAFKTLMRAGQPAS